jgi:hypothetical protein
MVSSADASIGRLSRIGGALYVTVILLGFLEAALIRERIVVSGNPAATAENLRSMATLWRVGVASDFVVLSCSIALMMILYRMLRPVDPVLAGIAVIFNIVSAAVEAVSDMLLIAAMLPAGRDSYLSAFTPDQRAAFSMMAIREYDYGFGVALIFFGFECVILGYLIYRSTYVPKVVGALMAAAGASYLTNSFALIVAPVLANTLFPAILLPALVGESTFALWLLLRGVDQKKIAGLVAPAGERGCNVTVAR